MICSSRARCLYSSGKGPNEIIHDVQDVLSSDLLSKGPCAKGASPSCSQEGCPRLALQRHSLEKGHGDGVGGVKRRAANALVLPVDADSEHGAVRVSFLRQQ